MDPNKFHEYDIFDAEGVKVYKKSAFTGTFESAKRIAKNAKGYVVGIMRGGTQENGGEHHLLIADFREVDGDGVEYSDKDLPGIMVHEEDRTHFFDGMACALLGIGLPATNVENCFGYSKGEELRKKFEDLIK